MKRKLHKLDYAMCHEAILNIKFLKICYSMENYSKLMSRKKT